MRRRRAALPVAAISVIAAAMVPASAAVPHAATPPAPAQLSLSEAPRQGGLVHGRVPAGTVALALEGKPVAFAADGRFILGFDRDQGSSARLVARLADGREVEQPLAIVARAWPIERVDAARRPGGASAAWLRRREGELARIAAARAVAHESEGWRQRFIWPARGRISGLFGAQRLYRGEAAAFHSGVDVAAGAGAPVIAPADGIVVLAGPPAFSLEGNLVIIDHGLGLNSAFLHLAASRVRPGQIVRQGDPIGTVGATGRATGPHLHWSMKWRDARIDPQALAGPMPAGSGR